MTPLVLLEVHDRQDGRRIVIVANNMTYFCEQSEDKGGGTSIDARDASFLVRESVDEILAQIPGQQWGGQP